MGSETESYDVEIKLRFVFSNTIWKAILTKYLRLEGLLPGDGAWPRYQYLKDKHDILYVRDITKYIAHMWEHHHILHTCNSKMIYCTHVIVT